MHTNDTGKCPMSHLSYVSAADAIAICLWVSEARKSPPFSLHSEGWEENEDGRLASFPKNR